MITQEFLNELFRYDNGNLYWLKKVNGRVKIGANAGCLNPNGYYRVKINRRGYHVAVLIWIYHNGPIPSNHEIDHIDRDKSNNRIENLRLATRSQNNMNKEPQKNNKSGYSGVCWHNRLKKWAAYIRANNIKINLGLHHNIEEAIAARKKAEQLYFKDFTRR